jgi:hypothetical protein
MFGGAKMDTMRATEKPGSELLPASSSVFWGWLIIPLLGLIYSCVVALGATVITFVNGQAFEIGATPSGALGIAFAFASFGVLLFGVMIFRSSFGKLSMTWLAYFERSRRVARTFVT